MIKYETIIYEQEDFDALDEMTNEEAIEVLNGLPRGYFPYRKPEWGDVTEQDYDNYKICCAIDKAVEALEGGKV